MNLHSVFSIVFVCSFTFPGALQTVLAQDAAPKSSPARIVGYLPEYRLRSFQPTQAKLVTDIVFFAVSPRSNGDAGLEQIKPATWQMLETIRKTSGVRLHLCLGGWNRSKGFAALSASPEARKRLAEQLVEFCQKHHFAGVDVDWEHPQSPAELANHGKLMTELHRAFAPHKLELSMAVAGWQELAPETIRAVDRVHLMAYDGEGKHSTLDFARKDIDRLIKRGVAANKICLGVPFYGRKITNHDRTLTYGEIVSRFHSRPDVDEVDGFYFNGPQTIEQKVKLAQDRKLAGIMIWELGQDASGSAALLPVIRGAVDAASPAKSSR
ncbi:glycosyl hydrolase family 18 protein [soil metagenome]